MLVVAPTRDARRARVEARVAAQMRAGWPEEVARLVREGHEADLRALRPLGYEAIMDGGVDRIVIETQGYAKRQATWFRHQMKDALAWDPDTESVESALAKLGLA